MFTSLGGLGVGRVTVLDGGHVGQLVVGSWDSPTAVGPIGH